MQNFHGTIFSNFDLYQYNEQPTRYGKKIIDPVCTGIPEKKIFTISDHNAHTLLQVFHHQISPFAKNNRTSKNFKMNEFTSATMLCGGL